MIIYLNGRFVPEEEASVSVFDHGFLYGDGVFEGIKAYDGRVFALDEHVDRFFESATSLQIVLPLSRDEMKEAILETLRRNKLKNAYIRPVASRGPGALGLDPRNCSRATIVIIVAADTQHPETDHGSSTGPKGIKVITSALRRNRPDTLSPKIKSTNYLNNILAKLQANAAGVQDAILLNTEGFVCELTGNNLFVVKNRRLLTPPLWHGVLDGVTRRTVLKIAAEVGIETAEEPLTLHDLYTSEECFCTATRIEIVPIVAVDGRQIGSGEAGPMTRQLGERFLEYTRHHGTPINNE